KLLSVGAGDEKVIPDDAEIAFESLNRDLVAKAAVGFALDLSGSQELNETVVQSASNVVAELLGILVTALPGVRADGDIALRYDLSALKRFEDDQLRFLPEYVQNPVVYQRGRAPRCFQQQQF